MENEYSAVILNNDGSVSNDSFDELPKFLYSMIGNTITHVYILVGAIQKWMQCQREYLKAFIDLQTKYRRQISLDYPTRWNSTDNMLSTMIGNRPAVNFMDRHILQQSDKDLRIMKDIRELLRDLVEILRPFHNVVLRVS